MQSESGFVEFSCNICGQPNMVSASLRHRELLNCSNCGSCARFRGIVNALQQFVLGSDQRGPLASEIPRKDISGIGMSDSLGYAEHFERLFSYTNTYYHTEPFLDVSSAESATHYQNLDFVVSSDVLEHVEAPISSAFRNIWSMLKPKGWLILSVPYLEGYETIEHFPHLNEYSITKVGDDYALVNRRADGLVECHRNLSFHGGPGSVLELRVFGEGDLLAMLRYAGFGIVHTLKPDRTDIGYSWDDHVENLMARGRKNKSHILACQKTF